MRSKTTDRWWENVKVWLTLWSLMWQTVWRQKNQTIRYAREKTKLILTVCTSCPLSWPVAASFTLIFFPTHMHISHLHVEHEKKSLSEQRRAAVWSLWVFAMAVCCWLMQFAENCSASTKGTAESCTEEYVVSYVTLSCVQTNYWAAHTSRVLLSILNAVVLHHQWDFWIITALFDTKLLNEITSVVVLFIICLPHLCCQ